MCGIIGYTGNKPAKDIILSGLSRLEYRGYDSSGLAIYNNGSYPKILKSAGKISELADLISESNLEGTTGIGHTRWATHGPPTQDNAHPHQDCSDEISIVHNGIVENFKELKTDLEKKGHTFESDTDTECIPHLIEQYLKDGNDFLESVRQTAKALDGANAILAVHKNAPDTIIAFRLGYAGGLVIGKAHDEMLIASDLPAITPYTNNVAYIEPGEIASINPVSASFYSIGGKSIPKKFVITPRNQIDSGKGRYRHYMLKEINQQPESIIQTLSGRVSFNDLTIDLPELSNFNADKINRVVLIGMGTSLHAAMVARHWIESFAKITTEIDNSSEFRYRDPLVNDKTLIVSICQSGETADTLAAMELARNKGAQQITLFNYENTQSTRIADYSMQIKAGPEIAVAASKTFTCSLVSLYLLAIELGVKLNRLTTKEIQNKISELSKLPDMIGQILYQSNEYAQLAKSLSHYHNFLFLGRGINHPIAMEGALKLKEISYIHAEGYPAGEMKHGPISLIDENMPVVAIAPSSDLYEKMESNINECKARGAPILSVVTEGNDTISNISEHCIYLPESSHELSPILTSLPLQLLSYHIAVTRGCDVDQPRNLAKSVTVE